MPASAGVRRRGAVRSEEARTAVLAATGRLFATEGYDHLTIEGIAAEAGVSKQTIYRWWPSKSAVVADALIEDRLLPDHPVVPDTGDIRADLIAWVQSVIELVAQPGYEGLVRSLIAAACENPDIGARLNDALGITATVATRIEAAVAAGQLPADLPVEEFVRALVGGFVLHALERTEPAPDVAERMVRALLH
ncbi:AcrR family transcriptional regulator [Nocardioides luteus]|uniref:TetR/AcrR family transcriptional regulator n=1 Tax=Nocardioides luteus TaxID=1844 RepID=UPI0016697BDB|nr:TetR/AcrR family transcriptional regulator [Nocardioides luteus]MDR7309474.1 AcrR family transcriptional regulator [Nocardioides luteus]